ncbi:LexA family protein [Chryseobacterium sp. SL1]|uniref:LexA family protein n=1 Tax=Chryseobacterium sp. SL1 TaxID=2995159 RepID=UPI00227584CE|nr:S24 family peptidase [Chryseobacterium sp. SL1]MCY1659287.1 LexA family transcriptional regulator [Chryseobacterium sp. SL1]
MVKNSIDLYRLSDDETMIIPVLPAKVKAGGYSSFESPALDFPEDTIDLLKILIKDKETVFFAFVTGDSLNGIGVFDGDLLIIQKGMLPKEDNVIIVFLDGEFYVKKYKPNFKNNTGVLESITLKSENPDYSDLYISAESDFTYWGKVTWNLHSLE